MLQIFFFVDVFDRGPFQFRPVDPSVHNINGFNAHSVRKINASNVVGVRAPVGAILGASIGATKLCVGGGGD